MQAKIFSILGSESQANTVVFPLMRDEYRGKTRIKWLGDFEALKSFAFGYLKLDGEWSFTSNNGGFHVLKSESVTLSFYPNTKHLMYKECYSLKLRKGSYKLFLNRRRTRSALSRRVKTMKMASKLSWRAKIELSTPYEDDSDNIVIQAND